MKLTIFYFLFFTHLCQAEFEKVSTPKKYLTLGIIQTLILDEIRDVKNESQQFNPICAGSEFWLNSLYKNFASKSGTQRDLVFGLDKNLEPHLWYFDLVTWHRKNISFIITYIILKMILKNSLLLIFFLLYYRKIAVFLHF